MKLAVRRGTPVVGVVGVQEQELTCDFQIKLNSKQTLIDSTPSHLDRLPVKRFNNLPLTTTQAKHSIHTLLLTFSITVPLDGRKLPCELACPRTVDSPHASSHISCKMAFCRRLRIHYTVYDILNDLLTCSKHLSAAKSPHPSQIRLKRRP